ncbi:MAG: DUF3987 domain-containing protein [Proteobacteria bacterium]|nr:DUF3987 domain-containing protein [Pseudomonadota bacterium]
MTTAQVKAVIDAAQEYQPEPPRPLVRETEPAEPFPINALGTILGAAAGAIQDRTQAPMAICAQSVLGAATLAVQGHADVELPTGHARPVSSFLLSIAATGERKSACDNEALWPIKKREKALREAYDLEHETWRNDQEAWETQRRQILGDKKSYPNRAAKKVALDDLGPGPVAPLTPMLTCVEPTFEGLAKLYGNGHPSLGIFSAEGGQFIGGHGMSPENKLRMATAFSALWDGEPIKRVRAGDGAATLPGRRLSMHLMCQVDVASVMLTDRLLADQGLLSRVLVTAPEPTSGTRLWRDPKPESMDAIKRYGGRLLDILETPLPLAEGKPNELDTRRLPLSPEARNGWIRFSDHVERQIGPGGDMEPIKGLANKLAEHAARLAAVVALVDDIDAPALSSDHLAAGIRLAEHYAAEAMRLFAAGRTDPGLLLAQRTLDWLHGKWTETVFSPVELYRLGPNAIRDRKTALKMISILDEHGWIVAIDGGAMIKGQRRREAWRIVRA